MATTGGRRDKETPGGSWTKDAKTERPAGGRPRGRGTL